MRRSRHVFVTPATWIAQPASDSITLDDLLTGLLALGHHGAIRVIDELLPDEA